MKPTILFPFIHSYGLMLAVGFYAAWWLAARRAKAQGLDPEQIGIGNMVLLAIVGGVGGARLWYFAQFRKPGEPLWSIIKVWEGGLVFYGGLIGAATVVGLYVWRRKLPVGRIADIVAPSGAIGQAFGRLGCFLNGCCFGGTCTKVFPLGVSFPAFFDAKGAATGSAPYLDHLIEHRWITDAAHHSLAVHPTQLYAALSLFAITALVIVAEPYKRRDGELFALVAMLNALSRFAIELVRRDSPVVALGLRAGQLGALAILAAGIVILVWSRRKGHEAWAPHRA